MKKIFFFAIPFLSMNVFASGLFMGEILTVASDGAFDAARNPALMVWSRSDAIGIAGQYRAYKQPDLKIEIESATMSTGTTGYFVDKTLNANLFVSYISKGDKSALGLSIIAGDDFQYTASKLTQNQIMTNGSNWVNDLSYTTETDISPALVISGAWNLSSKSSLGISLKTGYGVKKISEYTSTMAFPSDDYILKTEQSNTEADAELIFGWSFKEGPVEVGAMITSGKIVYKTKDYAADFLNITLASAYNSKDSTIDWYYNSMPLAIIGVYTKPFSKLAFAFETLYIMGGEWTEKEYDFDDNTSEITRIKVLNLIKPAFIFKGGAELHLSKNFIFSAGGFYSLSKMLSSNVGLMNEGNSVKILTYAGTAGIEIMFGKNSSLMIGSKVSKQSTESKTYIDSIFLKVKEDVLSVDVCFGASFGF